MSLVELLMLYWMNRALENEREITATEEDYPTEEDLQDWEDQQQCAWEIDDDY